MPKVTPRSRAKKRSMRKPVRAKYAPRRESSKRAVKMDIGSGVIVVTKVDTPKPDRGDYLALLEQNFPPRRSA